MAPDAGAAVATRAGGAGQLTPVPPRPQYPFGFPNGFFRRGPLVRSDPRDRLTPADIPLDPREPETAPSPLQELRSGPAAGWPGRGSGVNTAQRREKPGEARP